MFIFALPVIYSAYILFIFTMFILAIYFIISGILSLFKYKIFIREGIKCSKISFLSNFIVSGILICYAIYYIVLILGFSGELIF